MADSKKACEKTAGRPASCPQAEIIRVCGPGKGRSVAPAQIMLRIAIRGKLALDTKTYRDTPAVRDMFHLAAADLGVEIEDSSTKATESPTKG